MKRLKDGISAYIYIQLMEKRAHLPHGKRAGKPRSNEQKTTQTTERDAGNYGGIMEAVTWGEYEPHIRAKQKNTAPGESGVRYMRTLHTHQ
jgi:hypothetical protein